MAMAWGYRSKDCGPNRTRAVLDEECAADKIAAIIAARPQLSSSTRFSPSNPSRQEGAPTGREIVTD